MHAQSMLLEEYRHERLQFYLYIIHFWILIFLKNVLGVTYGHITYIEKMPSEWFSESFLFVFSIDLY